MRKLKYDVIQNLRFLFLENKKQHFYFYCCCVYRLEMSIFIRFNPNIILAIEVYLKNTCIDRNRHSDVQAKVGVNAI